MKQTVCLALCTLLLAPLAEAAGQADQSTQQNAAWRIESNAGSRLPGVDPSAIRQGLTIVSDAATRPLAQALIERFEEEGYRGIGEVVTRASGQGRSEGVGDHAFLRMVTLEQGEEATLSNDTALIPMARRSVVFTVGSAIPAGANLPASDLPRLLWQNTEWADLNALWPSEPIITLLPSPEDTVHQLLERALGEGSSAGQVVPNPAARLAALRNNAFGVAVTEYLAARSFRDLQRLEIDGTPATDETISEGSYPLTWASVLTVPHAVLRTEPAAAAFAVFAASYAAEEIAALGWYPLPQWQSADAVLQALDEEF